jgi:hypothetical protein
MSDEESRLDCRVKVRNGGGLYTRRKGAKLGPNREAKTGQYFIRKYDHDCRGPRSSRIDGIRRQDTLASVI